MKVAYGMGIGTAMIGQQLTTANKLLTLYREGGPAICPYHTLVLYATVQENVLVNKFTPEYVQTGFNNGHAVDQ